MRRLKHVLALAAALLLTSTAVAIAAPGASGSEVGKGLAESRRATKQFHDPAAAEVAGYVDTEECVGIPGVGAMGVHYVNFGLAFDLVVDAAQPEVLLYIPSGNELRLVAVEYFVPALANSPAGPVPWFDHAPPVLGFFNAAPSLWGHTFEGPMPGHDPTMPWHYELHVWNWQGNPHGVFSDFNPSLSCPA